MINGYCEEDDQADQEACQYTPTHAGISCGKYRENCKCQGNYIDMPFNGKFDDWQWAPCIENHAALVHPLSSEQNNQGNAGNHIKDQENALEEEQIRPCK